MPQLGINRKCHTCPSYRARMHASTNTHTHVRARACTHTHTHRGGKRERERRWMGRLAEKCMHEASPHSQDRLPEQFYRDGIFSRRSEDSMFIPLAPCGWGLIDQRSVQKSLQARKKTPLIAVCILDTVNFLKPTDDE